MRPHRRIFAATTLLGAVLLALPVRSADPPDGAPKPSPLFDAMKTELDRSLKTLGEQDPVAYYIGYTVTDSQRATVSGSNGALLNSDEAHNRWLEVTVRTGSYELDDTHKVDGRTPPNGGPGTNAPLDDDPEVLRACLGPGERPPERRHSDTAPALTLRQAVGR